MIIEDYVSFETTKLLKEKGFDASEINAYFPFVYYSNGKVGFYNDDNPLFVCEVVTLQMAMKWIREKFDIHCQIDCPIAASNWTYGIRDLNKDEWITLRNMGDYDTYEEACENAIKYVLENLI